MTPRLEEALRQIVGEDPASDPEVFRVANSGVRFLRQREWYHVAERIGIAHFQGAEGTGVGTSTDAFATQVSSRLAEISEALRVLTAAVPQTSAETWLTTLTHQGWELIQSIPVSVRQESSSEWTATWWELPLTSISEAPASVLNDFEAELLELAEELWDEPESGLGPQPLAWRNRLSQVLRRSD